MIEILLLSASLLSLAGSGVVLWKANNAQQAATQSVELVQSAQTEAEKFAEKSNRAAISSRSYSMSALSHSKSAQASAEKASDSAGKSADQSNLFSALMAKIDSSTPKLRTRQEAYDQVQAEVAAKHAEAKPLIDQQNRVHRTPHWLAQWSPKS
jgi:hypothetical protein